MHDQSSTMDWITMTNVDYYRDYMPYADYRPLFVELARIADERALDLDNMLFAYANAELIGDGATEIGDAFVAKLGAHVDRVADYGVGDDDLDECMDVFAQWEYATVLTNHFGTPSAAYAALVTNDASTIPAHDDPTPGAFHVHESWDYMTTAFGWDDDGTIDYWANDTDYYVNIAQLFDVHDHRVIDPTNGVNDDGDPDDE